MATERIDNIHFEVDQRDVDFIETSEDGLFFEIHLKDDAPQEPSYQVATTKCIFFRDHIIMFR